MSKSLEELVIVGVVALLALQFLTSSAALSAQTTLQSSTLGQTAGFASVGEGVLSSIGSFVQEV
jgi:hypothetical protein